MSNGKLIGGLVLGAALIVGGFFAVRAALGPNDARPRKPGPEQIVDAIVEKAAAGPEAPITVKDSLPSGAIRRANEIAAVGCNVIPARRDVKAFVPGVAIDAQGEALQAAAVQLGEKTPDEDVVHVLRSRLAAEHPLQV